MIPGLKAMVQSEQSRGEPRFYWVMVVDNGRWRDEGTEGEGSSGKRRCERRVAEINQRPLKAEEQADAR